MPRISHIIHIISLTAVLALILGLLPAFALPASAEKTVVNVTLSGTASASKGDGFYFTVSPADPLPYAEDWKARPVFTQGGVYLANGTLLESPKTLVKLGAGLYYIGLKDNHHVAVDGEIVYVDGTVETDTVKVVYERTAFQYNDTTKKWAIVSTVDGAQVSLGDTLNMDVAVTSSSAVHTDGMTVETVVDGNSSSQALPTSVGADGRYHVTLSLSAKDMTAPITLRLKKGETVYSEKSTSLRAYGESIVNGNYYDVYKIAAKAMLNYGAAAQNYFKTRTDDLANKNCAYTDELQAVNPASLPDMVIDGDADGYVGVSLVLKAATSVRLYFDHPIAGGLLNGNYYYVEVAGIGAADLNKNYTVTVENTTYTFSVLSLAKRVLQGSYDAKFVNLMRNLVLYAEAADALNTELLIVSPGTLAPADPYLPEIKAYLLEEDADVADYAGSFMNAYQPIVVQWIASAAATGYTVSVATKSDFSDAKIYEVDAATTKVDLYNLYKATKYYVKVAAKGTDRVSTSTFTTTDVGPRVMKVDGVYNVRDVGGYETCFGTTTLQGLLYRGGALNPSTLGYDFVNITEEGKRVMSEEMGIVSELDLRAPAESYNLQQSLIPGADLYYNSSGGYDSAVQYGYDPLRRSLQLMARPENYPIYFHCTGGADRTGTLSFLVGALLGYSLEDLIHDYEFTTFSCYGERNSRPGTTYQFADMYDYLLTFEGDNLAEKMETYLLSIGLTADEIYNIRAIMTGGEPRELNTEMELSPHQPVEEENEEIPTVFDYMDSEDTITLNASQTTFTSDYAVGYGQKVRIPLNTNTIGGNGSMYVYIGSYGIRLRAGEFRVQSTKDEIARDTGMSIAKDFFDNGGYLDISVTPGDAGVALTLSARDIMGGACDYTYTIPSNERLASEIASADAKITVKIDIAEVDELIIQGKKTGLVNPSEPDAPDIPENPDAPANFFDYMNDKTAITLNSAKTSVTTDLAVGYGNTVRIPLDLNTVGEYGSTYIYIGSYGVRLRSGQFRFHLNNGSDAEMTPRPGSSECLIPSNFFDNGGYMDMCVTLGETSVTFDIHVCSGYGDELVMTYTYATGRLADEIASADAKITVKITTSEVDEAILTPPVTVTEETVAVSRVAQNHGNSGFQILVSPADSLPNTGWEESYYFIEGGLYTADGTLLTTGNFVKKLSESVYYIGLNDRQHLASDGEIFYLDGVIQSGDLRVVFERTYFQYNGDTDSWSIVSP